MLGRGWRQHAEHAVRSVHAVHVQVREALELCEMAGAARACYGTGLESPCNGTVTAL